MTEGVLALETAAEQLTKVRKDTYRWKWVVLAIHNSFQAFMVAAIARTNVSGAWTREYAKHWHERYEKGLTPTMEERLGSFPQLFRKAQHLKGYTNSRPLQPTTEQKRSAERLNALRNDLVHYKPGSLSIEVSGLPKIVRDCLEMIRFLAFDSRYVFWVEDEFSRRTGSALGQAQAQLEAIERDYDP